MSDNEWQEECIRLRGELESARNTAYIESARKLLEIAIASETDRGRVSKLEQAIQILTT